MTTTNPTGGVSRSATSFPSGDRRSIDTDLFSFGDYLNPNNTYSDSLCAQQSVIFDDNPVDGVVDCEEIYTMSLFELEYV